MRTAAGLPADIDQRLATLGNVLKEVSPAVGRQFQDFRIREHRLLAERYARG